MAKYVIDISDDQINDYIAPSDDMIFRIPVYKRNGTFSHFVLSDLSLTPYTEPDEDESYGVNRYKAIGLAFLKWLGNDVGDKLKSADDVYRFLDKNCYNKDAVEQEVWEFASMLMNMHHDVAESIYWSMNGGKGIGVAAEMTYQEAKAKYESWQKQKDEIHEYDEIISEVPDNKAVIVRIDGWGRWQCFNSDGIFTVDTNEQKCWRKTGRSFPELGELLKKMRENQ